MERSLLIAMILSLASVYAFADIARPEPTKRKNTKENYVSTSMSIRMDKDAKEAKLLIPKSQLKQLRAELEQLDSDDTTASVESGMSRTQTVVSGAFLSLAFVFGGMFFLKRPGLSKTVQRSALLLAILAGLGSAATIVYANVGPPPSSRAITSKLFNKDAFRFYGYASGKIRVETTDNNRVELIVPDPQVPAEGE